jgi:hypothetical protein
MGKMGSHDPAVEVDEEIYVRFKFASYGYSPGAIVKARAGVRDHTGVHVQIWSKEHNEVVPAWSDLASFDELNAMEVLALAAAGLLPEEQHGEA